MSDETLLYELRDPCDALIRDERIAGAGRLVVVPTVLDDTPQQRIARRRPFFRVAKELKERVGGVALTSPRAPAFSGDGAGEVNPTRAYNASGDSPPR